MSRRLVAVGALSLAAKRRGGTPRGTVRREGEMPSPVVLRVEFAAVPPVGRRKIARGSFDPGRRFPDRDLRDHSWPR